MVLSFYWLLLVEVLGLLAFPLTYRVFHSLPDRGWAFSKPLGLLLLSYGMWLIGLSQTVPNSRWSVLLALLVMALVAWVLGRGHWVELAAFFRREARIVLQMEAVFIGVFLAWVVLRGSISVVNHTEQPMDLMFLNAVVTSPHYPPNDPWLAGEPVSYYYFGYLMAGVLTMLSGLATSVAYNLSLAMTAALSALAAFGVVYNLVRLSRGSAAAGAWAGVGAAFLLLGASNLAGMLELARAAGVGGEEFWAGVGIQGFTAPAGPSASWVPGGVWWWFTASRVVPGAITEFPFFSFLLGDMHPHLMSLPFVLMVAALGIQVCLTPGLLTLAGLRREWALAAFVPLAVGALAAINFWDLPLGLALIGGALLLHTVGYPQEPERSISSSRRGIGWTLAAAAVSFGLLLVLLRTQALYAALVLLLIAILLLGALLVVMAPLFRRASALLAVMVGASWLLFFPFHMTFESSAYPWLLQGLLTRPLHLMLVWGVGGALTLVFLVMARSSIVESAGPWGSRFLISAAIGFAPLLFWLQPFWAVLGYEVVVLSAILQRLGFRWAGIDEAPLAIGSGMSRIAFLLLLVGLLLYDGIVRGEQGSVEAGSTAARLVVVLPMAMVTTVAIYGAWTLVQQRAAEASSRQGARGVAGEDASWASGGALAAVLGMLAIASTLIMGVELFHVVDSFGGELRRMNTIFKLYYQAWVLMAVVGGFGLYYVSVRWDLKRAAGRVGVTLWTMGLVLVLGAVLYYPLAASYSRLSDSSGFDLDGQAYLAASAPAELAAIQWVRDNLPRDAVVVEAAVVACDDTPRGCGDWTAAGRIAASTGRPTVLAWEQHELQWRSSSLRLGRRLDDVREIYETSDPRRAGELLEKYGAQYVVVGPREQSAYGLEGIAKFDQIGAAVFSANTQGSSITIFRLLP